MSLHLGNHAKMIMNGINRRVEIKKNQGVQTIILRIFIGLTAIYGIYAFIKRKIISYLFMQSMFAFFDYSENRAVFFMDYIAMIIMLATVGYYVGKLLNESNNN